MNLNLYFFPAEAATDPEKVFTEEDWTDAESTTLDPYSKYKVLAEKLAWEFLKELPGMVLSLLSKIKVLKDILFVARLLLT